MTRRRTSYSRRRSANYGESRSQGYTRNKSYAEERVERLTWFFLVLVIAGVQILQQGGLSLPNWSIPFVGCVVLIGSGLYQNSKRWRVAPTTWLAGALLAALTLINLYVSPSSNFLGISLVVFAAVILMGLLTGET
jgi:hypothetical protein